MNRVSLAALAAAAMLLVAPLAAGAMTQDVAAVVSSTASFSTFAAALKAAGLADRLKGPGPFTVFAPTNDAFADLPAGTLDRLMRPENRAELAGFLARYIVAERVSPASLAGKRKRLPTVGGGSLLLDATSDRLMVGDALVLGADTGPSNGNLYTIDSLQPVR